MSKKEPDGYVWFNARNEPSIGTGMRKARPIKIWQPEYGGWKGVWLSDTPPVSKEILGLMTRYIRFLTDDSGEKAPPLNREELIKLKAYFWPEKKSMSNNNDFKEGFYTAKVVIAEAVEGWLRSQELLKKLINERPLSDVLMIINSVELKNKEPTNEC